jgi:hypothetical protein
MIKLKTIVISIICSIVLSAVQIYIGLKFFPILLWQVRIFLFIAGKGPILGYDAQGNPLYEGTPVHELAAYFGIFVGFLIYSLIFYKLFSRIWHNNANSR